MIFKTSIGLLTHGTAEVDLKALYQVSKTATKSTVRLLMGKSRKGKSVGQKSRIVKLRAWVRGRLTVRGRRGFWSNGNALHSVSLPQWPLTHLLFYWKVFSSLGSSAWGERKCIYTNSPSVHAASSTVSTNWNSVNAHQWVNGQTNVMVSSD